MLKYKSIGTMEKKRVNLLCLNYLLSKFYARFLFSNLISFEHKIKMKRCWHKTQERQKAERKCGCDFLLSQFLYLLL